VGELPRGGGEDAGPRGEQAVAGQPGQRQAESIDLGVGHRGLEVGAQRLRRAGGGQRGVPAGLGVAHGQPGGVEGQYPPQRLQRRRRPLGQIGTGRQSDPGQLLP
jgi:hypothetical protein